MRIGLYWLANAISPALLMQGKCISLLPYWCMLLFPLPFRSYTTLLVLRTSTIAAIHLTDCSPDLCSTRVESRIDSWINRFWMSRKLNRFFSPKFILSRELNHIFFFNELNHESIIWIAMSHLSLATQMQVMNKWYKACIFVNSMPWHKVGSKNTV